MAKFIRKVHYNTEKNADFQKAIKERVNRVIHESGGSSKATFPMWVRIVSLLAAHFFVWSKLALHVHSPLATLGWISALSVLTLMIVCSVVHEAGHHAVTERQKFDQGLLRFSFSLLGPNYRLFQIRHNDAHHWFTNIPGMDTDIEASKIIRFVPHVEWKPFHRFQFIYAPILYSLFTLSWVFVKDFKLIAATNYGNFATLENTQARKIEFYILKALYLAYMIVIPAIVLPYSIGQLLLGFFLYHVILSQLVTMNIASSHIFYGTKFVMPDEDGNLPYSFMEHALHTSVDYHPESRIVGAIYNGFNAHIAHHMFPNISAIHYPKISKVIRETAEEFGIPYYSLSLPKLYLSHLKFLKHLGAGPQNGFEMMVGTKIQPIKKAVIPAGLKKASTKNKTQKKRSKTRA